MTLSIIAVAMSAVALALWFWDRRARLRVRIEDETIFDYDEEFGEHPVGRGLSIDVVNKTLRRIEVASVWLRWSKWRWLPLRRQQRLFPELQRVKEEWRLETRFWVEPWGDKQLGADADELEYWLRPRSISGEVWVRVVVRDVLGKRYRSNTVKLNVPARKTP